MSAWIQPEKRARATFHTFLCGMITAVQLANQSLHPTMYDKDHNMAITSTGCKIYIKVKLSLMWSNLWTYFKFIYEIHH